MKTLQIKPLRMLAALAVGAVLATGFAATASAAPDGSQKMEHDWARHRQERVKARLAKTAERLGIQASQQSAWQAYTAAVESPAGDFHAGKNTPADAAGIARRRADMAAGHAAKLARIAEATAVLQAVLTPEQRRIFDRMAQHAHRRGHRHHDGHRQSAQTGVQKSPAGLPAAPAYQ